MSATQIFIPDWYPHTRTTTITLSHLEFVPPKYIPHIKTCTRSKHPRAPTSIARTIRTQRDSERARTHGAHECRTDARERRADERLPDSGSVHRGIRGEQSRHSIRRATGPGRGAGRGRRSGRGGGGRGGPRRNTTERPKKTAEDLDAEMEVIILQHPTPLTAH